LPVIQASLFRQLVDFGRFKGQALPNVLVTAPIVILNAGRRGRETRRTLLQKAGLDVLEATDGDAALKQAERQPSLIVLDLDLPGTNSLEVCRRLKRDLRTQAIPILLVTDTPASSSESVRVLAAGADWYLPESERPGVLVDAVRTLLDRRNADAQAANDPIPENLRQSQKMEAIGHLAFGVAHDFNNLLTAILGYTEMMLSQIGEDKPISADLMEIRKAGDRAAALTKQLLAFSRKQPLSMTAVDLNSVVSEAEQLLRRLIGEHIDLRTKLATDIWAITGDVTQLEQVLLNLVVNARDAMASGGTILVETNNVVLSSQHKFPDPVPVVPGRYALLMVQDTGSGMDEATRARLFEPFFTTKSRGRGTGLGLATVYGIIKHLRGYIFAESEPGHGTTFRLYFPAAVDASATTTHVSARLTPIVGRETILVVEDDDAVRRFTTVALRRYGYEVLEAGSPERALEIAEQAESVHLILTDVIMPGLSGPAFVHRVRQQRANVPTIYMSGYPGDAMVANASMETGDAQLSKPFATDELLRVVREVIDQAKNRQ
jgi:two-component system, cell cycle sensor histidine kinase and response regulator CckA